MKRIIVASLNQNKINAVKEVFPSYNVRGAACASGVREQPVSLDEIIRGSINRAKRAFVDCSYSVGIEDGISRVPDTASGYMNFCCCAIFDGSRIYLGLGPAFEYPPECTRMVVEQGITISEAFLPVSGRPDIGYEKGIIGWLTGGRINRKDYTKQAVEMAKIQLDNEYLYI
jgi:inosine/xanthosine triphosphatase